MEITIVLLSFITGFNIVLSGMNILLYFNTLRFNKNLDKQLKDTAETIEMLMNSTFASGRKRFYNN